MFNALQWHAIIAIAKKEILATLRDRRAMLTATLMPLLLLPFMALFVPLVASLAVPALKLDKTRVGIEGTLPEELRRAFEGGLVSIIKLEAVSKAASAKDVEVAIFVPAKLPKKMGDPPAELVLYQHSTNKRAGAAILAIQGAVNRYNDKMLADKLSALGIDQSQLKPLRTRTQLNKDGFTMNIIGTLLPILLIVWCAIGGQASAIEATVAERERGTLEALLGAPINRADAVLGKFMAVTLFGLLSGICGLLGIALTAILSSFVLQSMLGIFSAKALAALSLAVGLNFSFSWLSLLVIASTVITLSGAMCALVLLPCIFARSYKEVQFYMVPSIMLGIAAAVAANFKDFFSSDAMSLVPITSAVAVIGDAFTGKLSAPAWLFANLSNLVLVALLLWLSSYFMRREAVIFRGG